MTSNKKSTSPSRPLLPTPSTSLFNREPVERLRVFGIYNLPLRLRSGPSVPTKKAFTIIEFLISIVIIGVLATITIVSYVGIQQRATVAVLKSDLVNSTQALKLYQVEHSAYPTAINDCPSPATGNMCLKYSPNNTYPVFEPINNTNPQTFCLTVQSTNNTRYHITEDSVPELGSCSFPFAGSLTATTISPFSIDLAWNTVENATSYMLQQDTTSSFNSANLTTIATITPPDITEFTSDNLLPNTQYYYRVNATVDGEVSEWSTPSASDTTDPLDAPDAPVVTASTVDATTTWSWPGVTCATGATAQYRFDYFIDTISQTPSGWTTPTNPAALSIDFTTSTEGHTYTVEVQAQCFVGSNASQWSTSSGQVSYYRPLIPLAAIAAISGATTAVGNTLTAGTLTPSGATVTYQWQSATTSGGTYTNISSATASTYTLVIGNLGKYIKVVATATGSYSGTQTSAATSLVTTPITAIAAISGATTAIGNTLTAGALTPSGATVTYQWQSATTSGGTYTNISSATAGTYTLVIGDLGKYIKIAATGSGNYSGTVASIASSLTCPTGFIPVPGSATYGTSNFCVMKYEAKQVGSTTTPISTAAGLPWVSITQTAAIANSPNVASCTTGCHLITEAEWMTIAQNVLNVPSNWSTGTVGSGYIYSGHNDNVPANSLAADASDANGYSGTGNVSPSNQRRTLTLSNGEVIWDLAGNVWDWTSGTVTTGQPGVAGNAYAAWIEWPNVTTPGTLAVNVFPSGTGITGANSWTSANGIGQLISNPAETGLHGFFRGGRWASGVTAGVLTLNLGNTPGLSNTGFGFRVSR